MRAVETNDAPDPEAGHKSQSHMGSFAVIPLPDGAIGFTDLWPDMSRPSAAHTPLAREAGRGRSPLRSNGRVRGIPVIFFVRRRSALISTSADPALRAEWARRAQAV